MSIAGGVFLLALVLVLNLALLLALGAKDRPGDDAEDRPGDDVDDEDEEEPEPDEPVVKVQYRPTKPDGQYAAEWAAFLGKHGDDFAEHLKRRASRRQGG